MSLYARDNGTLSAAITVASGSNLTFAVWIKTDPQFRQAVGHVDLITQVGATNGFAIFRLPFVDGTGQSPRLQYAMANSAGAVSTKQTPSLPLLGDGQWHHVAVTDANSGLLFYVDGIRVAAANTFRSVGYTGAVTTTIAGNGSGTYGIYKHDAQLFARVLTPGEIKALADGVSVAGVKGRYCLGSALSGFDHSGTGNHLTTVSAESGQFTGAEDPPWFRVGQTKSRYGRRHLRGFVAAAGGAPAIIAAYYHLRRRLESAA